MNEELKNRLIKAIKKEYLIATGIEIYPSLNICDGVISITFDVQE